jgi:hypothetical protein
MYQNKSLMGSLIFFFLGEVLEYVSKATDMSLQTVKRILLEAKQRSQVFILLSKLQTKNARITKPKRKLGGAALSTSHKCYHPSQLAC